MTKKPDTLSTRDSDSRARKMTDLIVLEMLSGNFAGSKAFAKKHDVLLSTVNNWAATASYLVDRMGQRDRVEEFVRRHLEEWVKEGDKDRVASARLLLDSWGLLPSANREPMNPEGANDNQYRHRLRNALDHPDDATLDVLAEEGRIERLVERVRDRRAVVTEGQEG